MAEAPTQQEVQTEVQPEKKTDPTLDDVPPGASLSSGPYAQAGVLRMGAPDHAAFKQYGLPPTVEGRIISRFGKLWIKTEDGHLVEPTLEYGSLNHMNTRKNYRLLPRHFKGADSAKPFMDPEKEVFEFE